MPNRMQPLRSDTERNALAEANIALVRWTLKKYFSHRRMSNATFDECLSVGYCALLRAATLFDGSRGFSFASYSVRAIRRGVYRHLIEQRRVRTFTDVDAGGSEDAGTFSDTIADPRTVDVVGTLADRELADMILASVRPREREVLRYVFLEGRSARSLSLAKGLTGNRISQIVEAGILRARKALAKRGYRHRD